MQEFRITSSTLSQSTIVRTSKKRYFAKIRKKKRNLVGNCHKGEKMITNRPFAFKRNKSKKCSGHTRKMDTETLHWDLKATHSRLD